ncbi:hypothetical protein Celaphus_00009221, partial [Cervus elaphus hippelaphus]
MVIEEATTGTTTKQDSDVATTELCFEIPLFGSTLNKFAEKLLHTTKKAFKDPDIPAEYSLYLSLTLFIHSRKMFQHWIFTQKSAFSRLLYHLRRIWEFHFLER